MIGGEKFLEIISSWSSPKHPFTSAVCCDIDCSRKFALFALWGVWGWYFALFNCNWDGVLSLASSLQFSYLFARLILKRGLIFTFRATSTTYSSNLTMTVARLAFGLASLLHYRTCNFGWAMPGSWNFRYSEFSNFLFDYSTFLSAWTGNVTS